MNQEILKNHLTALDAADKEIKDVATEYEGKLEEIGGVYDKKLDELKAKYDALFEQIREEIKKVEEK